MSSAATTDRVHPFFTVIIPTCNRAEMLGEAVQSVLCQTFGNFELIIVDDHSADRTQEMIGSFLDSRIRPVINDRARGGAGARNAGIIRARGCWTAFLDDDDLWLPRKLEKQYQIITRGDPSAGLVYTGHAKYDVKTARELSLFVPEKEGWIQTDLVSDNCIGTLSSVAIRTDLLQRAGGLDERFPASQDYELYFRISGMARVAMIPEKLVLFRQHARERISGDMRRKLVARTLFWEKHKGAITDPRLRHRVAARYFAAAAAQGDIRNMGKSLPWTVSGLLFDMPNVFRTVRSILAMTVKRKPGGAATPWTP